MPKRIDFEIIDFFQISIKPKADYFYLIQSRSILLETLFRSFNFLLNKVKTCVMKLANIYFLIV